MRAGLRDTAHTDKARWERETRQPALDKAPERQPSFTTVSGRPIDALYTSDDLPDFDYARELNDPGQFPYTRGIHPTGYRGKLWTMRQFAGFGTPAENQSTLQATAGGGRHRPQRRVRPADADGARPGSSAVAG